MPFTGLAGHAADSEALQAGLELSTEGLVLLREDRRIAAVNSSAQALLRSALANLHGADFWDAVPEHIAERHRSDAERALKVGTRHTFVGYHAFEDQWIEYSLRRHASGLVVNLKDVTDTRRTLLLLQGSEVCNQNLFDGHAQAMWLFDPHSRRVVAANHAAAAFYGMHRNALADLAVEALFPAGEGAAWLASLPAAEFASEMRLCTQQKKSGERLLVELAASSVQWRERPAVLVSVVDVGARHLADVHLQRLNAALEQRIEHCNAELQRSHQELEDFTYAMSHDLKAPLHVVNGFTGALAERYSAVLDEQGRHYLARIGASTRQLAKLIDDLRVLTHLPRRAVSPEPVDLAPVCKRLVDGLCQREPARQLALEMAPSLVLLGDKAMLVTALECLINNAWKFTSKREQAWIKVGLMPGADPHDRVLFVSDNGAGFDAAYADKLFAPFQRLHSSADFPGGGLGLAIVKRVAQRHGGSVWGVSEDGGGATFFMSLPQGADRPQPPAS